MTADIDISSIEEFEFEDRMSDSDALMWSIEKDPSLRSTIVTVSTFDGPLDHDRIRHRVDYITRVIPRLRQRVRGNPFSIAPPRWEFDPHFDLNFHLRFSTASEGERMEDLLSMAEPVGMQGFDRARPLWEFRVVDGLDGGCSAVIIKIHHSITDGVGGMKLQLALFSLDPDQPEPELPDPPEVNVLSQRERVLDAMAHETRRGLSTVGSWARRMGSGAIGAVRDPLAAVGAGEELTESIARMAMPAQPLSPVTTGRSLSVDYRVTSFPLQQAKAAARSVGGRLNDAFIAGIALGLRSYHEAHARNVDRLRMNMPINVRDTTIGDQAGNAFIPARVLVPLHPDDPAELMRSIRRTVLDARAEPANELVELLSNGLNRLPTSLTTTLFGGMLKANDFTASNVPGAPVPVFLSGRRMTGQYAFGPNTGSAMNVTLVSYTDLCFIGINLDPAAVPDGPMLLDCLRTGFDRVLALAPAAEEPSGTER